MLYGKNSLVATTSDYLELFLFIFCLLYLFINVSCPNDIKPPVLLFMFICTACSESIYVKIFPYSSITITCLSFIVVQSHRMTSLSFHQSDLLLFVTLVLKNEINFSIYGLDLFSMNINLATVE